MRIRDIDKEILLRYLRYKYPNSGYSLDNITLYKTSIYDKYIYIYNTKGGRWCFDEKLYNECLEYDKIYKREILIKKILDGFT